MTKSEFLAKLKSGLSGFSQDEIQKTLAYYTELIDDHMEDGATEEEAVAAIGSLEDLLFELRSEKKEVPIVKAKKKVSVTAVILILLGFPLWFPLLVTFFSVFLTLYIVLWTVILVLYVGVLSCLIGGIAGLVLAAINFPLLQWGEGFFLLGCSILAFGLTILLFLATTWLAKQLCRGSGWLFRKTFHLPKRKEVMA